MKKLLSLTLAVCLLALLGGCAGQATLSAQNTQTESRPIPLTPAEEITYEVVTDLCEETVYSDDGETLLMSISFALPRLQAYADGQLIETPATPVQEDVMAHVAVFNEKFDQWRESENTDEIIASAKDLYEADPTWFGQDHDLHYSEELTCSVFRTGTLISIAATYYSYLGGAHPNTVYLSWNFDLDGGTFLTIPELANDPQAFTLAVADMIEVNANAQFAEDPDYAGLGIGDIYWDDYRAIMEKWGSDYAAAFDADGLNVIFSAYALAPYAAGAQVFHFPAAALDSYWSDSGRAVLGLN